MRDTILAAALAVAVAGCGDNGGEPPKTPASVTVTASETAAIGSLGDTRQLTAVVRDGSGNVMHDAGVTWSATPAGIVTLSSSSGLTVTATGDANGQAVIAATSGTASGQATIDVLQQLASVAVSPASVSVMAWGTQQLTSTAADARNNLIADATGYAYESADPAVATVNSDGLITGVAAGSTTVTVRLTRDGVETSTPVAVTVAPLPTTADVAAMSTSTGARIFNPASVEIAAGGTVTWTFTGTHNVTFTTAGAPANIPDTGTGGSAARTFPGAGTFTYTCTRHSNMNGTVVVR